MHGNVQLGTPTPRCGLRAGRGDAEQARAAAAGAGQCGDARQAARRGRQPRGEGRGSVRGAPCGGQAAGEGLRCMRGRQLVVGGRLPRMSRPRQHWRRAARRPSSGPRPRAHAWAALPGSWYMSGRPPCLGSRGGGCGESAQQYAAARVGVAHVLGGRHAEWGAGNSLYTDVLGGA